MVRTALIVLALAAVVTVPALVVVTAGGSYPAALVWVLWALWGVAVIGGGVVYLTAHRTGRL